MTEINRIRCGSSDLAESCFNLRTDKHRIFISKIQHKSNLFNNGSAISAHSVSEPHSLILLLVGMVTTLSGRQRNR